MSGMLGLNPEEVRRFAASLQQAAEQIETVRSSLDAQLSQVQWNGTDGDQFREAWTGAHTSALRTVVTALGRSEERRVGKECPV